MEGGSEDRSQDYSFWFGLPSETEICKVDVETGRYQSSFEFSDFCGIFKRKFCRAQARDENRKGKLTAICRRGIRF